MVRALGRSLPSHAGIHFSPLPSFLEQTVVLNGHADRRPDNDAADGNNEVNMCLICHSFQTNSPRLQITGWATVWWKRELRCYTAARAGDAAAIFVAAEQEKALTYFLSKSELESFFSPEIFSFKLLSLINSTQFILNTNTDNFSAFTLLHSLCVPAS